MKRVWDAILAYITDWKNLLTHALVGVGLLLIALLLPIPFYHRIAVLLGVVALNTIRMLLKRRREQKESNT